MDDSLSWDDADRRRDEGGYHDSVLDDSDDTVRDDVGEESVSEEEGLVEQASLMLFQSREKRERRNKKYALRGAYKGPRNEHGMRHGHGEYKSPTTSYVGSYVDGRASGEGVLIKRGTGSDGAVITYTGQFERGQASGHGVEVSAKGTYTGSFSKGHKNGDGHMIFASGDSYKGQWRCSLLHGRGEYTFKGGDRYVGTFERDVRAGFGTYHYSNGDMYEVSAAHISNPNKEVYTCFHIIHVYACDLCHGCRLCCSPNAPSLCK
jgi:hypothetical protein